MNEEKRSGQSANSFTEEFKRLVVDHGPTARSSLCRRPTNLELRYRIYGIGVGGRGRYVRC